MKDCQAFVCCMHTHMYLQGMKCFHAAIFDSFPRKLLEHSVRRGTYFTLRLCNCRYRNLKLLIFETDSITSLREGTTECRWNGNDTKALRGKSRAVERARGKEGKRERDGIKELIIRDVTRLVSTQRVECNESRLKSRQVGQRSLSRSFYLVARFLFSFLSPSKLQPTGAEAAHRQERRSALKETLLFVPDEVGGGKNRTPEFYGW